MFPLFPTATNVLFPKVTDIKFIPDGIVALSKDEPLSVDLTMVPESLTATNISFPEVTPKRLFVVGEVALSKDEPLSVDLTMFPELPTAMNNILIVKDVIVRVLLTFPEESVTLIVQSEYVPLLNETKVIVLFPLIAEVVLAEQEPP
jgi:hypothetical protein